MICQEISLNVFTDASFEWCTLLSLQFEQKKMLSPLLKWALQLEKVLTILCRQNDRDKPVMIFAETLLLFLWKFSETEKPSWQQPSLFLFFIGWSLDIYLPIGGHVGYESHDRPDLPCQKSIFIYKKHYYVPFYFAIEKIFYAEDRAKMNRELNLFVLWEIGFLARQIGHGSTMRSRLS